MTPEQVSQQLIKWLDNGAEGELSIVGALDVRKGQELKNISLVIVAAALTPGDTE